MNEQPQHDAEKRLWQDIERVHKTFGADQRELGKLFYALRNLYSERSHSTDRRPSSGHGVFTSEIKRRGFKRNRVNEWINDFEVEAGLRKPCESTAAKRKARRASTSEAYDQGYQAALRTAPSKDDPVSHFASLLPFGALKAAYRAALQELHPDHNGSTERTKELIAAWKTVEDLHSFAVPSVEGTCVVH